MTTKVSMVKGVSQIVTISCSPFRDQSHGTSGLRRNVNTWLHTNYTECFIQSVLNSLEDKLEGSSIVVGGDGRFYMKEAISIIINMCIANKVGKVYVGVNGLMSTPAVSHIIREKKAVGGFILTASHNAGGPHKEFGIKFNISTGGPAPVSITDNIFRISKSLRSFKMVRQFKIDLQIISSKSIMTDANSITMIEIIDSVEHYVHLMKSIFDFELIKGLTFAKNFRLLIDCMHGVTGPYAKALFTRELGHDPEWVINCEPKIDFGGLIPDPNLTHGASLIKSMTKYSIDFGAAFDADGDRNMVIGPKGFFVSPGDALAVFLANVRHIPYFRVHKVKGVARSLPTSYAVDKVAMEMNIPVYETPTSWKFFGTLLDAGRISLCGEESFGQGSSHIREKDGIWAVLFWLSIMAASKTGITEIVRNHWKKYGRVYVLRYDYENVDDHLANKIKTHLENKFVEPNFVGSSFGIETEKYTIQQADNFSYVDKCDGSTVTNQGLRIIMTDGSRIIYRICGLVSGLSIMRVYFETFERKNIYEERDKMLKIIIDFALEVANIKELINRITPNVIT